MAVSRFACPELSASFWERACLANPHGLGLMWFEGGEVRHKTTLLYDADTVQAWLRAVPEGTQRAVHLREATRGSRCVKNAHPHVHEAPGLTVALMHNGSLPFLPAQEHEGSSDSALLLREWLLPRLCDKSSSAVAFSACWRRALQELESAWPQKNRLVLLNHLGEWDFLGMHEGFWKGGTWVSNPRAAAWL